MNIKQFTKIIGGGVLALGMTQPLNAQQQDDVRSKPQPQYDFKYEHSSQPNSILYFTTEDRVAFTAPNFNVAFTPTNDVLGALGERPATELDAHITLPEMKKSLSLELEAAYSGRVNPGVHLNNPGAGIGGKITEQLGTGAVSGSVLQFFGNDKETWLTATADYPIITGSLSARVTQDGTIMGGYVFADYKNLSASVARNPLNQLYWANAGFLGKRWGIMHYGLFERGIASHTTQLGFGNPGETFSPAVQKGFAYDDAGLKPIATVAPTPSFTLNGDWDLEVALNRFDGSTTLTLLGGRRIGLGSYGTLGLGIGVDTNKTTKPAFEAAYEISLKGLTGHIEARRRPVSNQSGVYLSVGRKF